MRAGSRDGLEGLQVRQFGHAVGLQIEGFEPFDGAYQMWSVTKSRASLCVLTSRNSPSPRILDRTILRSGRHQERLTEPSDLVHSNDGGSELGERHVDVGAPVMACCKASELGEPGEGSLDHPTVASGLRGRFDAAAGDAGYDGARPASPPVPQDVHRPLDYPAYCAPRRRDYSQARSPPMGRGTHLRLVLAVPTPLDPLRAPCRHPRSLHQARHRHHPHEPDQTVLLGALRVSALR